MGCDYYIYKVLRIHFLCVKGESEGVVELQVDRQRGYFEDHAYDEDADDAQIQAYMKAYVECTMTPKLDPIVIFSSRQWKTELLEHKYEALVAAELRNQSKTWSDVVKIVKVETRV
jgi:hypothetical protein